MIHEAADGELNLQTKEVGHCYITVEEFAVANTQLMAYLMKEGILGREDMEYYLSYTAMIFDKVAKYEWSSILQYDTRYRELQASWG